MPERIRLFEPADLKTCYAISLATGFEGGDASHLYRDPKMMGHIYMAPYVSLAPEHAFVFEDEHGVAGFAVGVPDTAAWETRLDRDWWPALQRRYADTAHVPAHERTPDQRRAFMMHHPARTPEPVVREYPAHVHLNLLPRVQRRGLGRKLLGTWQGSVRARTHVGVNRANTGAARFWAAQGFRELPVPSERTLWMGRAFSASIQPD